MGTPNQIKALEKTLTGLQKRTCNAELGGDKDDIIRSLNAKLSVSDTLIKELKAENIRLKSLSLTDPLTEMPNLRAFQQRLAEAKANAKRDGDLYLLVKADLDNLKGFNDTQGWGGDACGDAAIKACGTLLKAACRPATDFIARVGGDEFSGLFKIHAAQDAAEIIHRLRKSVENGGFTFNNILHKLGISIGHVTIHAETDLEKACEKAHSAMKADKADRKVQRGAVNAA